jgi:hypothetical protein
MTYYFTLRFDIMERCSACKARLKGAANCRRCGADFSKALAVNADAGKHFKAALKAFSEQNGVDMLYHARLAFSKRRTWETGRLLACAALLAGVPELAFCMWRTIESKEHKTMGNHP